MLRPNASAGWIDQLKPDQDVRPPRSLADSILYGAPCVAEVRNGRGLSKFQRSRTEQGLARAPARQGGRSTFLPASGKRPVT